MKRDILSVTLTIDGSECMQASSRYKGTKKHAKESDEQAGFEYGSWQTLNAAELFTD